MFTFMLNHPVPFLAGVGGVLAVGVGLIIAACILTDEREQRSTDVTQLDGYRRAVPR